MTHESNDEKFRAMPLAAQIEFLGESMAQTNAMELLSMCGRLRDNAPLSWLCCRLLEQKWFVEAEHRQWFTRFLFELSDTAVDKIIKSLVALVHGSKGSGPQQLSSLLVDALRIAPVKRLSAMCLVDRALKHNFAETRTAYLESQLTWCLDRVAESKGNEITVHVLAQLSADAIVTLRERAEAVGPDHLAQLLHTHEQLAKQAVEVLGRAPKAVSQSNAEELLARRVYTDPGHFLTELIQNAEDADAVTWRVVFDYDKIIVWHDGKPFDTRDVVGVTSIGQTTKRKDQIGFFGVGFKAIYEVTDRPQIYSDVYNFEIADISIPKALSARPETLPQEGTLLIMPLRDPDDLERSSKVLYEKACALDPVILFTLRDIDVIDLELTAAAGGPARYVIREGVAADSRYSTIDQTPDNWRRAWAIQDDEYHYDLGIRMPGKPDSTKVMVGIALDDARLPTPIDDDTTTTVYSYLPTEEHAGISFFVQGHFDVPVDRERITQDSPWNRWILSKVPTQLARVFERLVSLDDAGLQRQIAAAFLGILPLENDLASPVFREITRCLPDAFSEASIIPGIDGCCHAPSASLLMPAAMTELFGGNHVHDPNTGAPLFPVNPSLSQKAQDVAASLGCRVFGVEELVSLLEMQLSNVEEGDRLERADVPDFLHHPEPEKMVLLYRMLHQHIESLETDKVKFAALGFVSRVTRLPLLLDATGGMHRARGEGEERIARGTAWIREVLGEHQPFVHAALDSLANVSESDSSETPVAAFGWLGPFFDRLHVPELKLHHVITRLEKAFDSISVPVTNLTKVDFPVNDARLNRIFQAVTEAQYGLQIRMARLPLFQSQNGYFYPAAKDQDDVNGVLVVNSHHNSEEQALLAALQDFYGTRRPIATFTDDDSPKRVLLERVKAPSLGIETLLADLQRNDGLLDMSLEGLRRLHALLEKLRDGIPSQGRRVLAQLPIWPDRQGQARPLRGDDAVHIPGDESVLKLFAQVPFIDSDVGARSHLIDMKVDKVGTTVVIDALRPNAIAPFKIHISSERLQLVWDYLLSHADSIGAKGRVRLAVLPVFQNQHGSFCNLANLCLAASPALRALYGDKSGRQFISDDTTQRAVIDALDLTRKLSEVTLRVLISDLTSLAEKMAHGVVGIDEVPFFSDETHLKRLHNYLANNAETLTRSQAEKILALPLYPNVHGFLCSVQNLKDTPLPTDALAVERTFADFLILMNIVVLRSDVYETILPLLETAQHPRFGVTELLERLTSLQPIHNGVPAPPIQSAEALNALHALLVNHRVALEQSCPRFTEQEDLSHYPLLAGLCIWPTIFGNVIAGTDVVDTRRICQRLPSLESTNHMITKVTLTPEAQNWFDQLAPLILPRDGSDFLAQWIQRVAVAGEKLALQPSWLNNHEKINSVIQVFTAFEEEWQSIESVCPLVNARDELCFAPLRNSDESTRALLAGMDAETNLLHERIAAALPQHWLDAFEEVDPLWTLKRFDVFPDGASNSEQEPAAANAHPLLGDAQRRQYLYEWLVSHETSLFTNKQARDLLQRLPLFPATSGRMLPPSALVVDDDLPDLGLDWAPHAEIPTQTIALLVRYLGVGKAQIDDLLGAHLLPAYQHACQERDGEQAGRILTYLARQLAQRSGEKIRALIIGDGEGDGEGSGATFMVENALGAFVPIHQIVIPHAHITDFMQTLFNDKGYLPHPGHVPHDIYDVLLKLGARDRPDFEALTAVIEGPSLPFDKMLSLCGLCGFMYRQTQTEAKDELIANLPLTATAWVPDETEAIRRPGDLYLWEPEVAALIGETPTLYLHKEAAALLTDSLCRRLGFRNKVDVSVEEVLAHIAQNIENKSMVPFQVYLWMERGLREQWLDSNVIIRLTGNTPWILTDDGGYYSHRQVIGTRALQYFGDYRGYWERGRRQCETLCAALAISATISSEEVVGFLTEIGSRVLNTSDRDVLNESSALPRMLLKCYEFLGEQGVAINRNTPVILCARHGATNSDAGTLYLKSANAINLFKSDTPTLETLFEEIGELYFVSPGSADDRVMIDRFYQQMGVRSLGRAYTIEIDPSKRDCSQDYPEAMACLYTQLRGLLSVLPRVKHQRTMMDAGGWVADERLGHIIDEKRVQAIDRLTVTYRVEGVGHVETTVSAVYDVNDALLLVDTALLDAPRNHVTSLAGALSHCIYEGAGADQLADILEILLRMENRRKMDDYLNRRHFPVIAEESTTPLDQLLDRVDEIVDYGLTARLQRVYPALDGKDLMVWRERDRMRQAIGDGTETLDEDTLTHRVVHALLALCEVYNYDDGLFDTLVTLLTAESLNDISAELLSGGDDGQAHQTYPDKTGSSSWGKSDAALGATFSDDRILDQLLSFIAQKAKQMPDKPSSASSTLPVPIFRQKNEEEGVGAGVGAGIKSGIKSNNERLARGSEDANPVQTSITHNSEPEPWNIVDNISDSSEKGFWQKLSGWFGWNSDTNDSDASDTVITPHIGISALPPWASSASACFRPSHRINSQLWADEDARQQMANQTALYQIAFSPAVLPTPYLYAPQVLGTGFNAVTQSWSSVLPIGAEHFVPALPTGQTVAFQGVVPPGRSQLPVPLYGRILGDVTVKGDSAGEFSLTSPSHWSGATIASLAGKQPVFIQYEVELLRVPTLTGGFPYTVDMDAMTEPMVLRRRLPEPVQQWLKQQRRKGSPWQQALAVQQFVRENYRYDGAFMSHPKVQTALRQLRTADGNHHLTLLHASGDEHILGRGICFELNTMVAELLRHLGIPSMVCTGWVLNEGVIDKPDHLFAIAILPGRDGLCLMPLEAAVGANGPIRAVGSNDTPFADARIRPPSRPGVVPIPGPWNDDSYTRSDVQSIDTVADELARLGNEAEVLMRAVRLVYQVGGQPLPQLEMPQLATRSVSSMEDWLERLRTMVDQQLPHPRAATALFALLQSGPTQLQTVGPEIKTLITRGLVTAHSLATYEIRPVERF